MKTTTIFVVLIVCLNYSLKAQSELSVHKLDLYNPKALITQLEPILNTVGDKKIIGLGEGTHGTKEFNDIRISIIKELIERKGFNIICFENPFGDSYYLNEVINSNQSIKSALKNYAISIWQTKEIESFLLWLRKYNQTHNNKVRFTGMDFNFITNSANIIQQNLKDNSLLKDRANKLHSCAFYQDSLWQKQNDTTAQIDFNSALKNGFTGYKLVESIDSLISTNNITVPPDTKIALLNCKYGFDVLYNGYLQKEGLSRDQCMADMVSAIISTGTTSKVIVWAHDGHVALKEVVFKNGSVGGMGGYLRKNFGKQYYVISTTTANGTYSATKDRFDTRINLFSSYTLTKPTQDSWENRFSQTGEKAFFLPLNNKEISTEKLKYRLLGYGPEDPSNYTKEISLNDYFDALIFIRDTTASNHEIDN